MNNRGNEKWLDKALSKTIGSEKPKPDFEQWKEQHPQAVEMLTSRLSYTAKTERHLNIIRIIGKSPIAKFAAAILIISSFVTCFVLSGKVTNLKNELEQARWDIAAAPIDDSVTINFYLKEHQDTIARYASHNSAPLQSLQMQIDQDDLVYYELFGNQSELLSPGMILIGPSLQQEISIPESPAISNGHYLTLTEARETCDFDLIAPARLHPGYSLDQIRRIENRDALQLLYTNGINSVSLFEQPLDGQRSLEPQDFREYAVFQNKGQSGGTILAWRDDTLSYVLIGNVEMSQLMNIAQSLSAGK